jgi:regulator of protease activity HflC (stomatin/prohibitin superfamily)
MFDRLVDFLIEMLDKALPCFIINHYDEGVLLRRGIYVKSLKGGIYFKVPFLDEVITHTVVPTTMDLPTQSLRTLDFRHVVVKAIIKYRVYDIKILLLEVWDAVDAISDQTQGIIKDVIMQTKMDDITLDIDDIITSKAKREAKKWGIEIMEVTITNLGDIRSIRLFNEQYSNND